MKRVVENKLINLLRHKGSLKERELFCSSWNDFIVYAPPDIQLKTLRDYWYTHDTIRFTTFITNRTPQNTHATLI